MYQKSAPQTTTKRLKMAQNVLLDTFCQIFTKFSKYFYIGVNGSYVKEVG